MGHFSDHPIMNKFIDHTDTPTNTQVLTFNSTKDQWDSQAVSGGIAAVVDDTSPQLGGNLDCNAFDIELDALTFISFDGATQSQTLSGVATGIDMILPDNDEFTINIVSNDEYVFDKSQLDMKNNQLTMGSGTILWTGSNDNFIKFQSNDLRLSTASGGTIEFKAGSTDKMILSATVLTFSDAVDIAFNTTTGTKIGTGATQKLSFWAATPVVQPGHIADATDAASAITQLNLLLADMAEIGLQAAS